MSLDVVPMRVNSIMPLTQTIACKALGDYPTVHVEIDIEIKKEMEIEIEMEIELPGSSCPTPPPSLCLFLVLSRTEYERPTAIAAMLM